MHKISIFYRLHGSIAWSRIEVTGDTPLETRHAAQAVWDAIDASGCYLMEAGRP